MAGHTKPTVTIGDPALIENQFVLGRKGEYRGYRI